ncbi:hypothetical protein [Streptomyces muensis]|uniref:Uncharacterized protein n=1 Tax=Streptomyces muensis TaxID=1077944 RepID=A0A9X1PTT2_STRM4|nr:hypothetical protein [Streptomyces muensis]MCF1593417.1 hypothetical protein [Streptomyces muensis]
MPELDFVHEADTENEPTDETLAFTVNGQQGSVIIDVTSTNMEGEPLRFDFSVTGPFAVAAVIVKGGPANDPTTGANLYDYRTTPAGQVEADETLHAQLNPNGTAYTGISHVAFCMVEDGAQT